MDILDGHDKMDLVFSPDKKTAITEMQAIVEYFQSRSRLGSGGGLFQPRPEKQWGMLSPTPDTDAFKKFEDKITKTQTFRPVQVYPMHGGTKYPEVKTPGGTPLFHYTTYKFENDKKEEIRLHMYGSTDKKFKSSFTQTGSIGSLVNTNKTKPLAKFLQNNKRAASQQITEKLLSEWAGKRIGFRPDQNTAMGGTSADDAAKASGFIADDQNPWQWLHLIAFTLGGEKSNPNNPNIPANLVAGSAAANGHHLVIENFVKTLIENKITSVVEIEANATMLLNSYHVSEKIRYMIKFKKAGDLFDTYRTYEIDTLSPNMSAGGDLDYVKASLF